MLLHQPYPILDQAIFHCPRLHLLLPPPGQHGMLRRVSQLNWRIQAQTSLPHPHSHDMHVVDMHVFGN